MFSWKRESCLFPKQRVQGSLMPNVHSSCSVSQAISFFRGTARNINIKINTPFPEAAIHSRTISVDAWIISVFSSRSTSSSIWIKSSPCERFVTQCVLLDQSFSGPIGSKKRSVGGFGQQFVTHASNIKINSTSSYPADIFITLKAL